jgi:hypothetical protein
MINRRDFIAGGALLLSHCRRRGTPLKPEAVLGSLRREEGETPIPGARWLVAEEAGDGLDYRFAPGTLAGARYLVADLLLDGNRLIVFTITLQEGDKGRAFHFRFGGLNQCSLRLRMPLSLVDQNRWGIEREGAFLKPRCSGDRVDLAKVDRLTFKVSRKSPLPARWCMTDLTYSSGEVEKLAQPILPKGPLLDELGQSTLHEWPAKTRTVAELQARLRAQLEAAPKQAWPETFSRWGGWKARRLTKPPGFFRTHFDGKRWWLVDPDGFAFWSAGLDCVRVDTMARYDGLEAALKWLPETGEFKDALSIREGREGKFVNYLAANFIRTFGPEAWRQNWAAIALAELRRLRFNTVGNWSDWEIARQAQIPYVRPMQFSPKRAPNIYRDFPDVFHPDFEKDAADYAAQLESTANDPAFLGYFLMNEPQWGFSSELPAAGMLFVTPACETRRELSRFLQKKYADNAALAAAWGIPVTFEELAAGPWKTVLPEAALKDLEAFSVVMTSRYFQILSEACRKVDPNHLNLGMRWAGTPPRWAVEGMRSFDVFSMNCYRQRVPADVTRTIHELLKRPVIIGEWHFGALDVGLPASGIGHLKNQQDRAKAYRVYLEDAAANPHCVGAHWFTLYDQSALGRFDGENYNIGFLDVCNRPYEELCQAAVTSHERLYEVAAGRAKPFDEPLEYLPNLY